MCELAPGLRGQLDSKLDRKKTEQRGEFDDRVQCYGGSVLERIAHRVADDGGIMEGRAFLLHFHFDDFLRVVPRAAGIGHEDGLVQPEDGDGDQVPDEEEWI